MFHRSTIWVRPLFTELGPKKPPKKPILPWSKRIHVALAASRRHKYICWTRLLKQTSIKKSTLDSTLIDRNSELISHFLLFLFSWVIFYCAMLRRTRLCNGTLSIRPFVLSVCDVEVFRGHIGWNSAVNFACGILSGGILTVEFCSGAFVLWAFVRVGFIPTFSLSRPICMLLMLLRVCHYRWWRLPVS